MRLFIAIELPEEVKNYLFELEGNLKSKRFGKINWVFKKNLHITLKFLGEVKEDKVEELKDYLKKIKFEKFKISLEDIGFYLNGLRINVIRIGIKPQEDIVRLQKLIDEDTLGFGDIKLGGHITLGRVKSLKNKHNFTDFVKNLKIEKIKFEVDSFILFKSDLKKEGPDYASLERYYLR